MRALAAAVSTAVSVQAVAAPAIPCLTEAEFNSVVRFVAPDLIEGVGGRCAASLPATAYLNANRTGLVARYRAAAQGTWPQVQTLVARVPEARIFAALDEKAVRSLAAGLLKEGLAKEKFDAADCRVVSDALAALDPLPAANLAALLTAFAHLDKDKPAREGKKAHRALLCPTTSLQ